MKQSYRNQRDHRNESLIPSGAIPNRAERNLRNLPAFLHENDYNPRVENIDKINHKIKNILNSLQADASEINSKFELRENSVIGEQKNSARFG